MVITLNTIKKNKKNQPTLEYEREKTTGVKALSKLANITYSLCCRGQMPLKKDKPIYFNA